ncbi:glycoside hydrolase family 3 N-terminal domain-containing protein [Haloarcula onubensis]|uniref:Glycoside hydrolase family 3 C-terminal domain-containing protein n=1 Tax=Haloarcula onubensis TaxID=2950539 RepID=A0ABU2FPQ0_9EURY|nr:glycoside hydrolase family 3 N-terminal domain-containing protein [Halomicroarcula sp. S3CR25-11]MDS0282733.1 glycoside hydrolase family 3 C-terminal domain-containing protein [Halomicroarcula sp. S3CR25-11]
MTGSPTVDALVDEMALEAKVAQLGSVRIGAVLEDGAFSAERARELVPHGVGRVTRVGRESGLGPRDLAAAVADFQAFLRTETPHGIPAFVREESLCGYAGRRGATVPQAIGLASSWDPALVREVAGTVGEQLRAVGCRLTLSPVADLGVDPRWGRIEETFGEDPALAAAMTGSVVRGLADSGVDATLKHFVGHGRPAGGRNRARPTASLAAMRDADCVPFRAGVDAGAASVMAAYNTVDGVPCHANEALLTDLLRETWDFDGTVVSDGRGIEMLADDYGVTADRQTAGVRALSAGIDVEIPESECFGERLVAAVREGLVDESVVDRALRRHLRQKVRAGLFTADGPDPTTAADAFETDAVRSVTRRAARRSQVLLENDGLLPLSPDAAVAVVGPNADAPRNLLGNYSYAGAENADGGIDIVTPRAALAERVETVVHERGCGVRAGPDDDLDAAVSAARDADVVVACVGGQSGIHVERDSPGTAGEALDRAGLGLPGRQAALVERVAATGTPVVVVLVSGRPLAVPGVVERANATVAAWLPGQSGGAAIADVLLGADPGGRLPVSLPRSVGQLPIHYRQDAVSRGDYVFADGAPLFPFGHGESYADFRYGSLSVAPDSTATDGELTATVTVENTADRPGTEVVQLYARHRGGRRVTPERELVGFRRVDLDAGETATVTFTLPAAAFATAEKRRDAGLVVDPGAVTLGVGRSSADRQASASAELTGAPSHPRRRRPLADVTVERA